MCSWVKEAYLISFMKFIDREALEKGFSATRFIMEFCESIESTFGRSRDGDHLKQASEEAVLVEDSSLWPVG